jgi:hypothetical protein
MIHPRWDGGSRSEDFAAEAASASGTEKETAKRKRDS